MKLVRRELNEPHDIQSLPEDKYGLAQTLRALTAWAMLQGVTMEWQEKRWFRYMEEMHVGDEESRAEDADENRPTPGRKRSGSQVHITTDVLFPHDGGQIVAADIGEASPRPPHSTRANTGQSSQSSPDVTLVSNVELKQRLRRLSKMVLAGYGGAPLIFFGIVPSSFTSLFSSSSASPAQQKQSEEAKLNAAINASEAEAAASNPHSRTDKEKSRYAWWDVLMGKHDRDILLDSIHPEASASAPSLPPDANSQEHSRPPTAISGTEPLMPRFWVITDHARREVVLAIRGTMSLNELAVDLTCDSVPIELNTLGRKPPTAKARAADGAAGEMSDTEGTANVDDGYDEDLEIMPGAFPIDISTPDLVDPPSPMVRQDTGISLKSDESECIPHMVHGGMLKLARAMGAPGKPVHVVVRNSLRRNKGYCEWTTMRSNSCDAILFRLLALVLSGHSLGAGVAALLAIVSGHGIVSF